MPRPNIIYLHSHDTGRYVQPYGHAIPTPHIQQLAEEGILFRQACCAAPTCSPSRAALLTGQAAHSSGMTGLAHRGFSLTDYRQHLIHTLRAAGYHSALIGVQHIASEADQIGYDQIVSLTDRKAESVAHAAKTWLANHPHEPFFLSVGLIETHREFRAPGAQQDPRYCLPPAPLPDTPAIRADMAAFQSSARALDDAYGSILDALDQEGLTENTLVICTTDHGIAFPGMKCNLSDHGIGVMLIMRGPGGFSGGRVSDALVSHIDIFPTICDLIEVKKPAWLQGRSLMPLIRGEVENVNEEIFAEVTYHAAYEPMRAIRTTRWKYVRRFGERDAPVLPNCDDSLSKDLWIGHDWQERTVAHEELYDLIFDPNEAHSLADDPSCYPALADLRQRLAQWMVETTDPLLDGPVAAPHGARVNDPNGLSPREPAGLID